MNIELKTYQDVSVFYLAFGWGCKSCGRLNSIAWFECEGDTYCQGCKNYMQDEQGDSVKFTQYPDGERTIQVEYDPASEGFRYAEIQRMEHERLYGYLPSYTGDNRQYSGV